MYLNIQYLPVGDQGILMKFGASINFELHKEIKRIYTTFKCNRIKGVIDLVPSYTTILTTDDMTMISYDSLISQINYLTQQKNHKNCSSNTLIMHPVG